MQSSSLKSSPIAQVGRATPGGVKAVRGRVSTEEWQARTDLAALYRLVAHYRWTDTIYTHISIRVPDEESFLINPFGFLYEEVTASSLVKVDAEGNVLDDPTGMGINKAGYVIHGALHAGRPDVHCVLHTHSRAGAAVSAQKFGLLPISQHSALFADRVAYHDFEGIAVRKEEQDRLVKNMGMHRVMILRNHGLLAAGRSAGETFYLINTLQRACEIQIDALSAGEHVQQVSRQSIVETQAIYDGVDGDFSRDWAAMLRLVQRIGPDYAS